MDKSIEYKGYTIRIENNKKDKYYPVIAVARNGITELRKRGYDESQAIMLVESEIDFIISMQINNKKEVGN